MAQTIACANQKGGVGKTTTVVNLTSQLVRNGDRVLVVDLDPQGNATSGFGVDRNGLDGSIYDAAGNLTGWNGPNCASAGTNTCHEYDAFGMMTRHLNRSTNQEWRYIYTADDERFWTHQVGVGNTFTLRDLDGKVLREYTGGFSAPKDYVYREGQLLARLGFELVATTGTARTLRAAGLEVDEVGKVADAADGEPTVVDLIRERRCDLVVNTPQGSGARADGYLIREAALVARVPCVTTVSGAAAAVHAIANARAEAALSLQERLAVSASGENRF